MANALTTNPCLCVMQFGSIKMPDTIRVTVRQRWREWNLRRKLQSRRVRLVVLMMMMLMVMMVVMMIPTARDQTAGKRGKIDGGSSAGAELVCLQRRHRRRHNNQQVELPPSQSQHHHHHHHHHHHGYLQRAGAKRTEARAASARHRLVLRDGIVSSRTQLLSLTAVTCAFAADGCVFVLPKPMFKRHA